MATRKTGKKRKTSRKSGTGKKTTKAKSRTSKKATRKKTAKTASSKTRSKRRTKSGKKRSNRKKPARSRTSNRTRRTEESEPLVVYVHGIGQGDTDAATLKDQWDLALFQQPRGDHSQMAFWGDLGSADSRRSRTVNEEEHELSVEAILRDAGLTLRHRRARQFVEHALAASRDASQPPETTDSNDGPRSRAIPLPEFLRRPISRFILHAFIAEAALYLFNTSAQQRIRRRLQNILEATDRPVVLVAHSLGSVIAYEVLSAAAGRHQIDQFVTLGSPLGIREIQDSIIEHGFDLNVPANVASWHNFADLLDLVALDKGLASDFQAHDEVSIRDHTVSNEKSSSVFQFNPHSAVGYLANTQVRLVVHDQVDFDSFGRFLIARDVAENFVDHTRQPVLLEPLHPKYWALGEARSECVKREARLSRELNTFDGRIEHLADCVTQCVTDAAKSYQRPVRESIAAAKIQRLRKYVSAHLTPAEITALTNKHSDINLYAIWRSTVKKKLISRSHRVIKVDAARASYNATGDGIVWAVLDTGLRWDHPHFTLEDGTDLVVDVLDCTQVSDTPITMREAQGVEAADGDRDGHGTHVAGTIAGQGIDGDRMLSGIAPRSRLIVYKVLDDNGYGEDAWIIKAIDDIFRRNGTAAGLRIHGVNLSLGGPYDASVYGCGHSPICVALRDLWRQGALVCVAAGNEGVIEVNTANGRVDLNTQLSIGDPANLEECIAVGSVNADKPNIYGISYFSSRGPTADGRAKPDLVAPGERIYSANASYEGASSRVDPYRADSGTSMACPHVSGLLAAFLSVRREFIGEPDRVKEILMENSNDLGRDPYHQGAGLPNLDKMLQNT